MMTRQQSDGELHVEAMHLMIEAHERREDPPDWTVWRHMLGLLATIFRGIEDQRRDDQDELMHTRKHRDHWKQARQDAIAAGELMQAEIDSLRQQLAEAQQQLAGAHAPAMAQQSEEIAYLRARLDEERSVSAGLRQQLKGAQQQDMDAMRVEVERLRTFADVVRTQVTRYTMSWASWNQIKSALGELDGQPATVAQTAEGGT